MLGERHPRAVWNEGIAGDGRGASADARPAPRVAVTRAVLARAPGGVWRDPVTVATAALVFGAYFVISLFRLLRLAPSSWDLGIYTEYVKQLSLLRAPVVDIRGPGFNLLGDHFQVALAVLAPFFRVFPSPATLLFFQALATALSVFPVVAAGTALTGKSTGRLIGFAYGFSWGLQQMIDFDFHEIALAVPLLAFSLSALVRRRPWATICWAVPLVFVKEDQGFTVAAIGLLLAAAAVFPSVLPTRIAQLSPGGATPRTPRGAPDGSAIVPGARLSAGGVAPRTRRGAPDGSAIVPGARLSAGGVAPRTRRGAPDGSAIVPGARLSAGGVAPRTRRGAPDGSAIVPGARLSAGGVAPRTRRGAPDGSAIVPGARLSAGGVAPRTRRGAPDGKNRHRTGRALAGRDRWGNGRTALWGGLFLVAWGLFWSVLAITVIIPHFNPDHVYYYWKDGGVVGRGGSFSVGALISQTASGWPVKLQTVVMLLLPTAFAALGSPVALVALPSLALRFMSTNSAYWGTDWHYNATLMPVLFIAAAEAIGRWRRAGTLAWPPPPSPAAAWPAAALARARGLVCSARSGVARHGGAMMAAVTVALAFQFPLSGLWHASTYRIGANVAAAEAAMAVVPDGATVQTTLDLLAPLGARTDTFWIGNAGNPLTQYIVFDGDDSDYSPPVTNVPAFIEEMYPHDGYVQVFERDDVYVYRRG